MARTVQFGRAIDPEWTSGLMGNQGRLRAISHSLPRLLAEQRCGRSRIGTLTTGTTYRVAREQLRDADLMRYRRGWFCKRRSLANCCSPIRAELWA